MISLKSLLFCLEHLAAQSSLDVRHISRLQANFKPMISFLNYCFFPYAKYMQHIIPEYVHLPSRGYDLFSEEECIRPNRLVSGITFLSHSTLSIFRKITIHVSGFLFVCLSVFAFPLNAKNSMDVKVHNLLFF